MKKYIFGLGLFLAMSAQAQTTFTILKNNEATNVKNQGQSGTCWCFSTTAMTESDMLKKTHQTLDLSETYTVYNLYIDKAVKYMRRQGSTRFSEGGLSQDMINAVDEFGAVPQSVYPGIGKDTIMGHDMEMYGILKKYMDSTLAVSEKKHVLDPNWKAGYIKILQHYLGTPPTTFMYNGKSYTPQTFAAAYVPQKAKDFIGLTSFTHHPFYSDFVMEVPDNYNSNSYYNLPLNELIQTVKDCIQKGYTLTWDADVSNAGFRMNKGLAKFVPAGSKVEDFETYKEPAYSQSLRQQLFDEQITQDDHLMQITGLAKDSNGNEYFVVKNSWGEVGPHKGYIYVSMPYFAINTISVVVNKNAVPKSVKKQLAVK